MKILGIIGGLGPMATAYFMQLITEMTDAATDQEHIEILVHNKPQIPDRTEYILGKSEKSPVKDIQNVGQKLVEQGAEIVAMPCVTAHFFQRELQAGMEVPLINAIEETANYLKERGIKKVGIMATDGTIESGILQKELTRAGILAVVPRKDNQDRVMHLIYENVKAGKTIEMDCFEEIVKEFEENNVEVILLGCTELSLIKRDYPIGSGFLDIMEVLARKSVLECGTLKAEYQELITR